VEDRIKLGISSCLLGNAVRYDGGHKLDRFLRDTLGQYVEYVPVCPEAECGLGIPRESMRLVGDPNAPRLVTTRSERDLTDPMRQWAGRRLGELEGEGLCGFIFKSDSPSSGMERVKVYDGQGGVVRKGSGIFAGLFMKHFPLLPVEDDGRLHDLKLRENFIEAVFVLKRWRDLLTRGRKRRELIEFHTRHKLLLLAHSPNHYRLMGKLVARAKEQEPERLYTEYQKLLGEALRLKSSPAKNANVLMHMMGYFKNHLSSSEKSELLELIGHYRQGDYPLIVPVTLFNHYVRKYQEPYLANQHYLNPHPIELRLRNHV
jgi:uncharacterized protein YbgA (DUF1722 family)/uncharacterized protein YbbK (DUF523 family)